MCFFQLVNNPILQKFKKLRLYISKKLSKFHFKIRLISPKIYFSRRFADFKHEALEKLKLNKSPSPQKSEEGLFVFKEILQNY